MNDKELEKGKVYLRDIRNGRMYQYEEPLSQMAYIERVVGGEDKKVVKRAKMHVSLNGLERAAEFDRKAAMTPAQRKAEEDKAEAAKKAADSPKPPAPKPKASEAESKPSPAVVPTKAPPAPPKK